tara:strand:+ start:23 stop:217 length:195 start_codon:yes stop_codon:yes gene_type:complete
MSTGARRYEPMPSLIGSEVYAEIAREIRESAKWIKKDYANIATIESEIRALRAAADKLERLNRA